MPVSRAGWDDQTGTPLTKEEVAANEKSYKEMNTKKKVDKLPADKESVVGRMRERQRKMREAIEQE